MNKHQTGQVSLLVLLVAAVITTLGLSVSQKTVLETKIDTDEEALKQAFSSAESGIEYYLGSGATTTDGKLTYTSPDGKSQAKVEVTPLGTTSEIDFGSPVLAGDYEYYWMAPHNPDGSLNMTSGSYEGSQIKLCLSSGSLAEVVLLYQDGTEVSSLRRVVNFSDNVVNGVNSTSKVDCGADWMGVMVDFGATGTKILVAVSPLGASTNMKIQSETGFSFPSQGSQITAVGEAGNISETGGDPVRSKVAVQDRYKLLPFLLNPISAKDQVLSP
ncbi:MAG: hypothetical protein WCT01_01920 [Candidatus Shapirobacteria bacterium]